ncbi:MAG TPA: hypothetical protein VL422_17195 [Miltoncostaea sp.]|nr:hypothetical protein [Miltoncostaea sp.]
MRGYGFTAADGRGTHDGVRWPLPTASGPGDWATAPPPSPLRGRVRGLGVADLPFHLDDAMWVVELDGDVRREQRLSSATRGRLVTRVAAWDEACATDYAHGCELRARAFADPGGADGELMGGYLDDLHRCVTAGLPPVTAAGAAGYIAARVAAIAAGPGAHPDGAAAERAAQARWLADRLGLADDPGPGAAEPV